MNTEQKQRMYEVIDQADAGIISDEKARRQMLAILIEDVSSIESAVKRFANLSEAYGRVTDFLAK